MKCCSAVNLTSGIKLSPSLSVEIDPLNSLNIVDTEFFSSVYVAVIHVARTSERMLLSFNDSVLLSLALHYQQYKKEDRANKFPIS
jgi:hypothetical protein